MRKKVLLIDHQRRSLTRNLNGKLKLHCPDISLSSYQTRNAKPLNGAALWSDDLELTILEPQQRLSTLELPLFSSKVPAGFPSPADDHLETTIDLNQHCFSNLIQNN